MDTHEQHEPRQAPIIDEIAVVQSVESPKPAREATVKTPPDAPLPGASRNELPEIEVSVQPAMVTPLERLQRTPARIDCLFCKQMTITKVENKRETNGPSGAILCILCLVCFPLLFCAPLFGDEVETWTHVCGNCRKTVAIRSTAGIDVKQPPLSDQVPSKFGAAERA
ncbi:hypothetical protein GGR57DRAFT_488114 [Xylariaceae sp. FL1272]|nr:hypothetical protein GGR57DRAFT_488114 [Xylariaceae sp. FL1272]